MYTVLCPSLYGTNMPHFVVTFWDKVGLSGFSRPHSFWKLELPATHPVVWHCFFLGWCATSTISNNVDRSNICRTSYLKLCWCITLLSKGNMICDDFLGKVELSGFSRSAVQWRTVLFTVQAIINIHRFLKKLNFLPFKCNRFNYFNKSSRAERRDNKGLQQTCTLVPFVTSHIYNWWQQLGNILIRNTACGCAVDSFMRKDWGTTFHWYLALNMIKRFYACSTNLPKLINQVAEVGREAEYRGRRIL